MASQVGNPAWAGERKQRKEWPVSPWSAIDLRKGQPRAIRYAEPKKTLMPPDPAELLPAGTSMASLEQPLPLPTKVVEFLKHRHLVTASDTAPDFPHSSHWPGGLHGSLVCVAQAMSPPV
jgi:hypothetical protein